MSIALKNHVITIITTCPVGIHQVGPAPTKLDQHLPNIDSTSCVCCVIDDISRRPIGDYSSRQTGNRV